MSTEPLPCPFCGGEAHYGVHNATTYSVTCKACGAQGTPQHIPHYVGGKNWKLTLKARAIEHWNTRKTT